jgi:soluble lytic murein transglycosylase-like protein
MNTKPLFLAAVLGVALFAISARQAWATPINGLAYENYFKTATARYNLPPGLLSRMALQESNYNPNASNPSGALGIMQIIPRWHPGVNVYDPRESIFYAGSLMRAYYNEFKNWPEALAAYNWGETNVRNKGLAQMPLETRNYIRNVLGDIGLYYAA